MPGRLIDPQTTEAIAKSKRYIETFDRLAAEGRAGKDLYDAMLKVYPDYDSPQSWLMLGFNFTVTPETV